MEPSTYIVLKNGGEHPNRVFGPYRHARLAAGTIEGVNPDGTSETIANLDYESDTWFSDIHDRRLDWADVQIRDTHFPPEAP